MKLSPKSQDRDAPSVLTSAKSFLLQHPFEHSSTVLTASSSMFAAS